MIKIFCKEIMLGKYMSNKAVLLDKLSGRFSLVKQKRFISNFNWKIDWCFDNIKLTVCIIDEFRYSVVNFLDKNKDTLYQDFKRLLYNRYVCSFSMIIVFVYLGFNLGGYVSKWNMDFKQQLSINICSTFIISFFRKIEIRWSPCLCWFDYTFYRYFNLSRPVKPWFFVTFNIVISHIFPENFIDIPQVVQKIWRISL